MGFQVPISISDAISRIRDRRLLLPAIQREFVWDHTKVEWLFDSLLQDYPIGSFLFWEVRDSASKSAYKYYEFLREYRERYRTENPEFNTSGHQDFEAVLDGQQRLTTRWKARELPGFDPVSAAIRMAAHWKARMSSWSLRLAESLRTARKSPHWKNWRTQSGSAIAISIAYSLASFSREPGKALGVAE